MNCRNKLKYLLVALVFMVTLPSNIFASARWVGPGEVHFTKGQSYMNPQSLHHDLFLFRSDDFQSQLKTPDVKPTSSRLDVVDRMINNDRIEDARKWLQYSRRDLYFLRVNFPWRQTNLRDQLQQINYRLILLNDVTENSDELQSILSYSERLTTLEEVELSPQKVSSVFRDDVVYLKKLARANRGDESDTLAFKSGYSPRKIEWKYLKARRSEQSDTSKSIQFYNQIISLPKQHYLKDDAYARKANLHLQIGDYNQSWNTYMALFEHHPFTEHYHAFFGTLIDNFDQFRGGLNDINSVSLLEDLVHSYQKTYEKSLDPLSDKGKKIRNLDVRNLDSSEEIENYFDKFNELPDSLKGFLLFLKSEKHSYKLYSEGSTLKFEKALEFGEFFPRRDIVVYEVGSETEQMNLVRDYPSSEYSAELFAETIENFSNHFRNPDDFVLRILISGSLGSTKRYFDELSESEQRDLKKKIKWFGLMNTWLGHFYKEHTFTSTSVEILNEYHAYLETEWLAKHFMHVMHHYEGKLRSIENFEFKRNLANVEGHQRALSIGNPDGWTGGDWNSQFDKLKGNVEPLVEFLNSRAKNPESNAILLIKSFLHLMQNKPKQVKKTLNKIERDQLTNSAKGKYHYAKGRAEYFLGNENSSINHLKQASDRLNHKKMRIKVLEFLATLYESRKEFKKAIEIYHDLGYSNDIAYLLDVELDVDQLIQLYEEFRSKELNRKVKYTLATKYFRNNNYLKAETLYEQLNAEKKLDELDTMVSFQERYENASSRSKKASVKYEKAAYVYDEDLLFYNPEAWGGHGRVTALHHMKLLPFKPNQSDILNHMHDHNVKMRARRLFKTITEQFSDVQPTSPKSYYMMSLADLWVASYNSIWTGGYIPRARETFLELQNQHPDSYLADDALYWAAFFTKDKAEAEQIYKKMINEYPEGDMTEKIKETSEKPRWWPYKRD